MPSGAWLTRVIAPVARSATKMSLTPLVSPATRLSAELTKTTFEPSPLMEASVEPPSAAASAMPTLSRVSWPVCMSLT